MERVKQMREKLYELGAHQSSLRKLENMKKEREPDVELDIYFHTSTRPGKGIV